MNTIRVILADDDRRLRDALRLLVDSDPQMTVVAEASDGTEAVAFASTHDPDVVLMDVRMPRMDGVDATRKLLDGASGVRVIVLTMFDADEDVDRALRAGASGFLLKNGPPAEVLRAIRVAYEGNAVLAPEVTKRLIARLSPISVRDDRLENLTSRERETLALIGRGLSNAEIARELFVTPTTVRTYVSRILSKVGVRDRAQLVVAAYESGLVTAPRGLSTVAD